VRSALKKTKGVGKVTTDIHKHTVKITFDNEKINIVKIKKTIENAGFKIIK
jgi:copper chaperone CopZ